MAEFAGDFQRRFSGPFSGRPALDRYTRVDGAGESLKDHCQTTPPPSSQLKRQTNTMNSNEMQRSGRRRRGGRRRSKERGERVEAKSAPKQTLWQKIIAFFRPKNKANGRTPAGEARPARNYPVYEPRQKAAETTGTTETERRPSRKPEAVEVTTPKVYVGNLSFDAAESDLFELFNGVGKVQSAELVTHRETEKSKGFGFVIMTTVEEAKRAVTELHDKEFMGRKLVVSGAKTKDAR
jgi:hypothetical protein